MPRETRELDLQSQTWEQLESLRKALSYEEIEEVVVKLSEIGVKGIQLTTDSNRVLRMMGGERTILPKEYWSTCEKCGHRVEREGFESEANVKF